MDGAQASVRSDIRERTQISTHAGDRDDDADDRDGPAVARPPRDSATPRPTDEQAAVDQDPDPASRCGAAEQLQNAVLGHRAAGVVARLDDAEPGADASAARSGRSSGRRRAGRAAPRRSADARPRRSRRRARSRRGRRGRRPAGRASRWRAPPAASRSPRPRASPRRAASTAPAQRLGMLGERRRRARARAIVASIASRPAASRPAPSSITTLRPSRSSAWMPCVPSWIMFRRLSRQYCSTGKSRV